MDLVAVEDGARRQSPEQSANILSRLFFSYVNPLVIKGYARPLEAEDIYAITPRDEPSLHLKQFDRVWNEEVSRGSNKAHTSKTGGDYQSMQDHERPAISAFRLLRRAFGRPLMWTAVFKVLSDLIGFIPALSVEYVVDFLNDKADGHDVEVYGIPYGYFLVAGMFLASFLQCLLIQQFFAWGFRAGMNAKSGLMCAIYNKALRLPSASTLQSSLGQVTSLQSIDVEKIVYAFFFFHFLWSSPLVALITLGLLIYKLGYSALIGFSVILVLFPLQGVAGGLIADWSKAALEYTDQRLKLIGEVVQGIRLIKYFAWENSFALKIKAIRDHELTQKLKISILTGLNLACTDVAPILVSVIAFLSNSLITGEPVSAGRAFTSVALFNMLSVPLFTLPMTVAALASARTSSERIISFLNQAEIRSYVEQGPASSSVAVAVSGDFDWSAGSDNQEDMDPIRPSVTEQSFRLREVHLQILRGHFVTVIGQVGSGKSSILHTILGEMNKIRGSVRVAGTVSFCSQNPWIVNASVRDNILFGRPFDQNRYDEVIEACALQRDLSILSAGDMTEIGERGINLSGGQKARVSLARAVYANTDIVVLDDVLSAVDAHVAKHIFDRCLVGLLAEKTRILASHQLQFLSDSDMIVVMRDGVIEVSGTLEHVEPNEYFQFLTAQSIQQRTESPEPHETAVTETIEAEVELERESASSRAGSFLLRRSVAAVDINEFLQTELIQAEPTDGQLIEDEEKETGAVSAKVWALYARYIGVPLAVIIFIFLCVSTTSKLGTNWWLNIWTTDPDNEDHPREFYIYGYMGLAGVAVCMVLLTQTIWAFACIAASRQLHRKMLSSILSAPMSFFDTTPAGRILNRFSRDTDVVDSDLRVALSLLFDGLFLVLGTLILQTYVYPWLLLAFALIFILYIWIQNYYRTTARELKRLDALSKSPILAHFSETLNGLSSIRAYSVQNRFGLINEQKVLANIEAFWSSIAANRWLGIRLDVLGSMFVLATSLVAVLASNGQNNGVIGFCLAYSIALTGSLNWIVRDLTDCESYMTSVERIVEYCDKIPSEVVCKEEPLTDWPSTGSIVIRDLVLKYRPELRPVLCGVSVDIEGGEKVGIVGRTGAGKSSLILALYRLVERTEGFISIDGVDIAQVPLTHLRNQLSIIPQDPILFSGDIRYNLDPFQQHSDTQLMQALVRVGLDSFVNSLPDQLGFSVSEGGLNFSVGQRQLLCMARALLRSSKILILDEATASVDSTTDSLIQSMLREAFVSCTVLTVAHRLLTIMDYDKILVLGGGKVLEFGSPSSLLEQQGEFSSLVDETGTESAAKLREIAKGRTQRRSLN
eukprot:GILK01007815.1.p1 GENE.GILK01007815.1~~GILK01007815.1.p1  ORF type:complete len:1347 (-),score=258.26 GILK01007815.1:45-4052(-)